MIEIQDTQPKLRVPKGGLKVGLLYNDLTQLMTNEDAQFVRARLSVRERSGPGLLPFALAGLAFGVMCGAIEAETTTILMGGLIGGLVLPLVSYAATRMGFFDCQALRAAGKALEKANRRTL